MVGGSGLSHFFVIAFLDAMLILWEPKNHHFHADSSVVPCKWLSLKLMPFDRPKINENGHQRATISPVSRGASDTGFLDWCNEKCIHLQLNALQRQPFPVSWKDNALTYDSWAKKSASFLENAKNIPHISVTGDPVTATRAASGFCSWAVRLVWMLYNHVTGVAFMLSCVVN